MTELSARWVAVASGWAARGWWLGSGAVVVALGALSGVVACGASKDGPILPGPSTSVGGSSGGHHGGTGGVTAGGGGAASDCPAYAPDSCTDGTGKAGCVSLQTDATSCGECGHACEPQAACVAGECGPAPTELTQSSACGDVRLALHGSQLFWTERKSGRVRTMPAAGGTVIEVASKQAAPNEIAADDGGVYWVDTGDGSSASSQLMNAALPLGAAPSVRLTAPGTDPIVGLAVGGDQVFYGLVHDIHAISANKGDESDVVVGVAFARNDTRVPDGEPNGLSLHDGRVYWIVTTVGSVESDDLLPGPDGTPRVGHSAELWPNDLGFAGDYVYYAALASLFATKQDVPAVPVASSTDDSLLVAFAVNESEGFFADEGGHLSRHVLAQPAGPDFQPTPSTLLAQDQGKVTSVVLDDDHVYWASVEPSSGDCAIRTLAF